MRTNTIFTEFSPIYFRNLPAFARVLFLILFAFSFTEAQNPPTEIRGYKVYNAKISVKNQSEKSDAPENSQPKSKSEAFIKVGEPEIVDVSLTGITLELSAEIDNVRQSGTIDFVSFKDFRVNDLAVSVEEYKESFSFRKNQKIVLPKPVKFFLGAGETVRGALREINDAKDEWTVTGTVFVFGKFKKFGFNFKRVVPIEINLKIKNPLKRVQSSRLKVQTQKDKTLNL